jgi:hypothetical protein
MLVSKYNYLDSFIIVFQVDFLHDSLVENRPPLFAYLYGPVTIMLLGNAIVVIMIVFALCKISRYSEESTNITLPNLTGYLFNTYRFHLILDLISTSFFLEFEFPWACFC